MVQGSEHTGYRPYQSAIVSHPGQLLREAREAAGIEQAALAEELYLTLHYVQAIEAGEFSRLPGATFVRGYLRSYAKRMAIPEHRVMELYDEYLRDQAEHDGRARREGTEAERWQRRIWFAMGCALLLLVSLGLYSVVAPDAPSPDASGGSSMEAAGAPETGGGAVLTTHAEKQLANMQAAASKAERAAADRVETRDAPPVPVGGATVEPAESAPAAPPPVDRFEQRSSKLEMHFYADCWIQVKDASGTTLAFGVKRAGDAIALEGESPYSVRVGNVRGAKLVFNGEEVDLRAYAVNNTANFVLN